MIPIGLDLDGADCFIGGPTSDDSARVTGDPSLTQIQASSGAPVVFRGGVGTSLEAVRLLCRVPSPYELKFD